MPSTNYVHDSSTTTKKPIPYTTSPLKLMWQDIILFFKCAYALPGIVFPLAPYGSGSRDELYPSWSNIFDISFHIILILLQLIFLSLFVMSLFSPLPLVVFVFSVALLLTMNRLLCHIINGSKKILKSDVHLTPHANKYSNEIWIFQNGVAVGQHWLQANLDRLAITFGRRVYGVHNATYDNPLKGIIFDVIECIIQRDFSYSTSAIRKCYEKVKEEITKDEITKVVFILHSQGGIEGGMVLDWLFADVPNDIVEKLEVYTFGNAANHFNDPLCRSQTISKHLTNGNTQNSSANDRIVRHIEHYANSGDFVSQWGVLEFDNPKYGENRFVGRLFTRDGGGHMMNQHYLDSMFTLETPDGPVRENNSFMNSEVEVLGEDNLGGKETQTAQAKPGSEINGYTPHPLKKNIFNNDRGDSSLGSTLKPIRELSRLWQYRNGKSPQD